MDFLNKMNDYYERKSKELNDSKEKRDEEEAAKKGLKQVEASQANNGFKASIEAQVRERLDRQRQAQAERDAKKIAKEVERKGN